MGDSGTLLAILALHLALTGLPGVAATLFAARRGVREAPVLLAIGLAASGAAAILAFWAFYAEPRAGETYAFLVVFGSVVLGARSLYGGGIDPALLRRLATPLALWALGAAFLVFLGFVHGGTDDPLTMAGSRFSTPLPSDSRIPLFFSDWFFENGHRGTPPVFPGEWLSSDRPPLQLGYVLSQRPFGWDTTGLHYQVLGVVLQQLWIVGLWALLVAARVGRTTRALAMVTVLVGNVAILHGFFVWPKMLPAAFLLAAAALVATPLWPRLRGDPRAAALLFALFALALLGHGSSIFGVVPLAVLAAARGLPGWRWLGVGLLVGIVLMAPWFAYQRLGDPPGNRPQKWMLAGVVDIDDRSTTEAIVDSYREAGLGGAIGNKVQNFLTMAGGEQAWSLVEAAAQTAERGEIAESIRALRAMFFFYLLPSLGLLLLAPPAIAAGWGRRARSPDEWRFAIACFSIVLIGCAAWGLLLFGSVASRTSLQVASLAIPVLAICGCVAGLRATFPRFAVYYVALGALLMLAVYAPALDPPPGTGYSAAAILLAAAGLAGFGLLAFGRERAAPGLAEAGGGARPDERPEGGGEGDHRHQRDRVG